MTDANYVEKLNEICAMTISEQAKYFLRAFVLEFQGNFEQILEQGYQMSKYSAGGESATSLDEHEAHLFLEKRGTATTVVELRDALRTIDLNSDGRMAFIEFLSVGIPKNACGALFTPRRC
eukprot:GABV01003894.1.p1 GENE.GABV01003894.1~~GABV01003894.1.p1  ORF type:complete len:121 (+),score=33.21 GABV01003894.1:121-483(+)